MRRSALYPVRLLLPLALGYAAGLAAIAAGTLWHIHAPWRRAHDAIAEGSAAAVPAADASDVLLAISSGEIREAAAAGRFPALDLSWGWANLIGQEIGPLRVLDVDATDAHLPADAAALVWSRSACRRATAAQIAALRAQVAGGATLLLEMPAGDLAALGGFTPDGSPVAAGGPLRPDPAGPLGPGEADALGRLDLPVPVQGGRLDPGARVLLRSGDRAAAAARRLGEGTVITLLFDAARLVTSLQQGTPSDDLQVHDRYPGRLTRRLESNDLVASEALLDNDVPYADLVERMIAGWIEEARPLPEVWGYPGGADGAFLMTHDDEGWGDRAAWMTDDETRRGEVSTSFFMPSRGRLHPATLAAIVAAGSEVGIHWDRTGDDASRADWMLGPMRLLRVERGLDDQIAWLRGLLPPPGRVRASRVHYLDWGSGWATTLQKLAAAGIGVDSSYGVDLGCRGYLFGTGRPFRPLDPHGLPLPLLEVPHLGAEDLGGFDAAYLARLLAASRAGRHEAITVLFHPNAYEWTPSVALFHEWTSAFDAARREGHVPLTMSALAGFEAAREATALRSEWRGGILEVRGRAPRADLAIVIPETASGRPLRELRSAGGPVAWRRVARMGRPAALAPVPEGPFVLTAVYAEGGA